MKITKLQLIPSMPPTADEVGALDRPDCEIRAEDLRKLCGVFQKMEYVGMGPTRSLRFFSEIEFQKLLEDFRKAPPERMRAYRPLLAHMTRLDTRETGRLVLPHLLCAYAGLRAGQAILAEPDDGGVFLCAPEHLGELEEMLNRRQKAKETEQ